MVTWKHQKNNFVLLERNTNANKIVAAEKSRLANKLGFVVGWGVNPGRKS